MMDTAVMTTDLDKLAERVERAAALVIELRSRAAALEKEKDELQRVLDETRSKLQGQDAGSVVSELGTLRKEQREWLAERKDVAGRIEAILRKLDKIEV